jgi:DNA processing protein
VAERVSSSLNGRSSFLLTRALEALAAGEALDDEHPHIVQALQQVPLGRREHWQQVLDRDDVRLVTVLDDDYPSNLRMVQDGPPFLFVKGSLLPDDERAIAVVGTRSASSEGLDLARQLGRCLAERGVTVVSGLAAGVDAEAHEGALDGGGRTIAVFGTGIDKVYPAANRDLARRITASGAAVSQFWPDTSGARWTFPARNIVTSGLSIGTVVVEASETSGARLQAENAVRHGKRLFLVRKLVQEPWAHAIARRPGVTVVDDIDDIMRWVEVDLAVSTDAFV